MRKKKKFIDKKKSATFVVLARDSCDPVYAQGPENDRVFVRVDNNPVSIIGLNENENGYEGVDYRDGVSGTLPDHVRREILELGFPDDGYDYLSHLREIRNAGAGTAYFENSKANLRVLPDDVKAYDASGVCVAQASENTNPKMLYKVAEKTLNVSVQKAVDPDIAKLLEEAESEVGSEVDDLEEDFVIQANIIEETESILSECLASVSEPQDDALKESGSLISRGICNGLASNVLGDAGVGSTEKLRLHRSIDQQFDLLEHQEYDTDSDDGGYYGLVPEEDVSLAEKLNNALKGHKLEDLELDENYKAPADILHDNEIIEILRRCVEYAEKYENEDDDNNEVVIVEETSDESENFDCETIVSTYSYLDNHPGRIDVPEFARKKRLAETSSEALKARTGNMISLGGKDKLPVDYLPTGKKSTIEKPKADAKTEPSKRKSLCQESKEEKKERKAHVMEERREALVVKKELKGVYCCEATCAQKIAADSGPSSIHLS